MSPPSDDRLLPVACLQFAMTSEPDTNRAAAVAQIETAAAAGAKLIVTPELFATPYFCQAEDHDAFALAEPLDGPTATLLAEQAARHRVVIVGSIFERRAAGLFHNTALVFDADGRRVGVYRKMHIPDDPQYYEKFFFTPGDAANSPFAAFDTAFGRVGVLVCWDQWFPEAARLVALHGAEVICIPTAIGWHPAERAEFGPAQLDAWQTIQRSHAIASGVVVAVANRIGHEPTPGGAGDGIDFWGHSFVVGPDGQTLAAADDAAAPLVATCDLQAIQTQRTHWPFLRDRRIDAYAGLTQRWLGDASR